MVTILINAIKIIFLLGFLIFIHEGGHFLVAKACKVKVKEFAIGFGPVIWQKQGKKTKYVIRLIPLGGFVNMLGEAEYSEEEGSFSKAKIWKRICIVVAGAVVNIIFGLLLYFILGACTGKYVSTTIDEVIQESAAQKGGLIAGDKIIEINDKKVKFYYDIIEEINKSNGNEVKLLIDRNNSKKEIYVTPMQEQSKAIGIYLGVEGENLTTEINGIYENSPAKDSGIQVGDIIIEVDGVSTEDPYELVNLISNSQNDKIDLKIKRDNEIKEINISPEITTRYSIGIVLDNADSGFLTSIYYAFWDTLDFGTSIIENLKSIFTGGVSVDQLMGPIRNIKCCVQNGKHKRVYIYVGINIIITGSN